MIIHFEKILQGHYGPKTQIVPGYLRIMRIIKDILIRLYTNIEARMFSGNNNNNNSKPNSIFSNAAQNSTNTNGLFGGGGGKPPFSNNQTNTNQGTNPANTQPQQNTAKNMFGTNSNNTTNPFSGNTTANTGISSNTANTSTTPTGTNNIFGQNKPGSIFGGSQATGQTNQLGQPNQTANTGQNNQPGQSNPATTTGQSLLGTTTPGPSGGNTQFNTPNTGGGILGNAPQGQQSAGQPSTGSQPGGLFSNPSATNGTTLFQQNNTAGNKPLITGASPIGTAGTTGTPAATSIFNQTPTTPTVTNPINTAANKPAGSLFNQGNTTTQNQPASTGQAQGGGNMFAASNNAGGISGTGGLLNAGQNQGQSGSGQPAVTGASSLSQPQDNIEAEFDQSNKTVADFINECKTSFLTAYEDLQKLCDSTLIYLGEREENQKIAKNFAALEPHISNKSEFIMKTLDGMERQQDEIERALDMMSKRMGQGRYTHELSEHLEEYELMKQEIIKLQDTTEQWNDPESEQLVNIFENLNQIEMQIKEMDQIADIYLHSAL